MTDTVHPYTFIPLESESATLSLGKGMGRLSSSRDLGDGKASDLHSGVIKCSMTTKTQIAIPEPMKDENGKTVEGEYDFFHIRCEDGETRFVVPGSSLRGVIRGVYENLTGSCLSKLENNRVRARTGLKKPGLLQRDEEGEYLLYKAVRYKIKSHDVIPEDWKTGKNVKFTPVKTEKSYEDDEAVPDEEGCCSGYYLRVDRGPNNAHPSIFKLSDSKGWPKSIGIEFVDAFRENVEAYVAFAVEKRFNSKEATQSELNDAKEALRYANEYKECFSAGGCTPVWYSEESIGDEKTKEYYYTFSPAKSSRSVFAKRPSNLMPDAFRPCIDRDDLCPACELFGFVGSGKENARAGHLRFSDARGPMVPADGKEGDFEMRWLPDLLQPKPSSLEFYFRNDSKRFSFTPNDAGTQISGRKYYWHNSAGGQFASTKTGLNSRMRVVPRDKTFEFEVYFDSISDFQIKAIVYALTLGNKWHEGAAENNKCCCHKIGHGKPVGLGSVCIDVVSVLERTVAVEGGAVSYTVEPYDFEPTSEFEEDLLGHDILRSITDFNRKRKTKKIEYPTAPPDRNGNPQMWTAVNRGKSLLGREVALEYKEVLAIAPSIGYDRKPAEPDDGKEKPKGSKGGKGDARKKSENHGRSKQEASKPKREGKATNTGDGSRLMGVIDFYNKDKGYGFIRRSGSKNLFFHISDTEGFDSSEIARDLRVSYCMGTGRDGRPAAKCVQKA